MSEYESDFEALIAMLEVKCNTDLFPFLSRQLQSYADKILANENSKKELEDFLKLLVSNTISKQLSKAYTDRLHHKYYSPEGLQLLVFYMYYDKATGYIKEKK